MSHVTTGVIDEGFSSLTGSNLHHWGEKCMLFAGGNKVSLDALHQNLAMLLKTHFPKKSYAFFSR